MFPPGPCEASNATPLQIFPASPSLTHTSHCFRFPKLPLDNNDCVIFDQGFMLIPILSRGSLWVELRLIFSEAYSLRFSTHWLPNAHCPVEVFLCTFNPPNHTENKKIQVFPTDLWFQQAQDVAAYHHSTNHLQGILWKTTEIFGIPLGHDLTLFSVHALYTTFVLK